MGYLGWVANLILIAGALLVGEKSPAAFVLVALGEFLWAAKISRQRPLQWDMLTICIVFGLLAVRNLYLWLK